MKKFKKILCCAVAGCMTVCMLCACSGKTTDEAADVEDADVSVSVQAEDEDDTETFLDEDIEDDIYEDIEDMDDDIDDWDDDDWDIPTYDEDDDHGFFIANAVPSAAYENLNGPLTLEVNGVQISINGATLQDFEDAGCVFNRVDIYEDYMSGWMYTDEDETQSMKYYVDTDEIDFTKDYKTVSIKYLELYEGTWTINGYTFDFDGGSVQLSDVLDGFDEDWFDAYVNDEYGYSVRFYEDSNGGVYAVDFYIKDRNSAEPAAIAYDDDSIVLNGTEMPLDMDYDEVYEFCKGIGMSENDVGDMEYDNEDGESLTLYEGGYAENVKWSIRYADCSDLVVGGFITPNVTTQEEIFETLGVDESYADFSDLIIRYGRISLEMEFYRDGTVSEISVYVFDN